MIKTSYHFKPQLTNKLAQKCFSGKIFKIVEALIHKIKHSVATVWRETLVVGKFGKLFAKLPLVK